MSNHRNLNYVLGSIGVTIKGLSPSWRHPIPPIECLVVNKKTRLPGPGFRPFLSASERRLFESGSRQQKLGVRDRVLKQVQEFPDWPAILLHLGVQPIPRKSVLVPFNAARGSEPESEDHRRLKEYVAHHPEVVDLPPDSAPGKTEYLFPSQDRIDVLFKRQDEWVGVEVKSARSGEDDIQRGLFQCVKYEALMRAELRCSEAGSSRARAVLVLEGALPASLATARARLGVHVVEGAAAPRTAAASA